MMLMKDDKFIWRTLLIFIFVSCFVLFSASNACAIMYGSILVEDGVPVTPNPAPSLDPAINQLPTNIRFFKSGPSPIADGLGAGVILATGIATNALYSFNTTANSMTIYIHNGNQYGKILKAKNTTSQLVEDIQFPGGISKAYVLQAVTKWYLKAPPPAPPIDAELDHYTTNFEPVIRAWVIDAQYDHPNHELSGGNVFQIIKTGSDNLPDAADFNVPLQTSTNGEFVLPAEGFAGIYWIRGAALNWWVAGDYSNANWSVAPFPPVKVTLEPLPDTGASTVSNVDITLIKVTPGDVLPVGVKVSWTSAGNVDIYHSKTLDFAAYEEDLNVTGPSKDFEVSNGKYYFKVVPAGVDDGPATASDIVGVYVHRFSFSDYGINVYAVPFAEIEGLSDISIVNFKDFYTWIVGDNGLQEKAVTMLGYWKDPKTPLGYTFDDQGNSTKINVSTPDIGANLLDPRVPVQISVQQSAHGKYFVVVGKR